MSKSNVILEIALFDINLFIMHISKYTIYRIIIFIILFLIGYNFESPEELDLGRYYESIKAVNVNTSIINYIQSTFSYNFDFIYFTLLYVIYICGLPMQLLTGLVFALLFDQSILTCHKVKNVYYPQISENNFRLILFYVLFSVSHILLVSISRNAFAVLFFIFAFNAFFDKKNIKGYIFIVLSLFTHTGIIIYLLLFAIGYNINFIFRNCKLKNIFVVLVTIFLLFSHGLISNMINLISNLQFFQTYSRYSFYLDISEFSFFDSLHFIEVVLYYYILFLLFIGFILIKDFNKIIWSAFFIYCFLLISINSNVMFTQRTLMFLLPFYGLIPIFVLNSVKSINLKHIYKLMLMINVILNLLLIYAYRSVWFPLNN